MSKDYQEIDIAIANLIFSGLSIAQIEKIPKWLLENIEKKKAQFKTFVSTYSNQRELEGVEKGRKEERKAFGGCTNCYGKGYHTTLDFTVGHADFPGDVGFIKQNPQLRYCGKCERGEQLKALLTPPQPNPSEDLVV